MGVLYGHPMSGKTTVLKAVLSVVGQSRVIQRKWFLIYYKLEFNSVQKLWLGLAEQYQVKQQVIQYFCGFIKINKFLKNEN